MVSCKTQSELLKVTKEQGFTKEEMNIIRKAVSSKKKLAPFDISNKGVVHWHISNERWDKMSTKYGLGFHVGTRDVVTEYNEQMYSKKDYNTYLYKVELLDDMNMVELTDPGDSGWDLDTVKKEIVDKDLSINIDGIENDADMRRAILEAGYDGVKYVNRAEYVGEELNSLIVMNPDKVKVKRNNLGKARSLSNEDYDKALSEEEVSKESDYAFEVDAVPSYSNAVWNRFNGNMPFRFRGSKDITTARVISIDVNYDDLSTKVVTDKGTYTFDKGSNVSRRTKSGIFVQVNGLKEVTEGFISSAHEDYEIEKYLLGSSAKSKEELFKDDVEVDGIGDVAKMQELVDELARIDVDETSSEMLEHYKSLIGKMKNENFTDMKMFLETNAESTLGRVVNDKINIRIGKVKEVAGNAMTAAEVYAHEVVHAYTMFGMRSNRREGSRLRRKMRRLRDTLADNMTWKDFLPEESFDSATEEANAKKMYDYIFNNEEEESLDEFVAHVLTNPRMIKVAKTVKVRERKTSNTLFDWVLNVFNKIMDAIAGKFGFDSNKKIYTEVEALAMRLGDINNEALVRRNEEAKPLTRFVEWFDNAEHKVSEALHKQLAKAEKMTGIDPMPRNGSKWEYAKWLTKWMPKMLFVSKYRPYLELALSSLGMKPEGIIQNVIRDFRTPDELEAFLDRLNMASGKIDRVREDMVISVKDVITEGFVKKLSKEENKALHDVLLETDVQSLNASREYLYEVLNNEQKLMEELRIAKNKLKSKDEKNYLWHVNQAVGLGVYMVSGKGNEAQGLNALAIARGLSGESKEADAELVGLIDKVATLSALSQTNKRDRGIVAKLVLEESKGVNNVLSVHKNFIEESKDKLFAGYEIGMMKGYVKDVVNDSVSIEVAPLADKVQMERLGYELVGEIEGNSFTTDRTELGLYKSRAFNRREYFRTATRLTNMGRKGTTITDIAMRDSKELGKYTAKLGKAQAELARARINKLMESRELEPNEIPQGLLPVYNGAGIITDYRYTMSKDVKEKVLEQDKDVGKVLGRSVGSIFDKKSTEEHNKGVLEAIFDDMDENYVEGDTLGRNDKEYIVIGENATDKNARELWKVLPSGMKEAIKEREGYIAVRRDMMLNYFGFRYLSLADNRLARILPVFIRRAIKIIEELWMAVVSIAKVDILIRVPMVVIGNIVSNFVFGVMTGTSPLELMKVYVNEGKNIREYMNKHKELMKLEAARDSGNVLGLDIGKINRLKADLKNNPIHELMETGIYESIMEDLNEQEAKNNNVIGKWLQEKTEGYPEGVKTAWNWMTLNDKTSWYKNMEMMLRMGDLLGQAAQNHKRKIVNAKALEKTKNQLIKDGLKGSSLNRALVREKEALDKKRLEDLSYDFIYYSKPSSALEEYANKVGLVMFTKYAKRIQRIIGKTSLNYPLRSLLVLMADDYMFGDRLETIMDQSLFDRSWYNFGIDPTTLLERVVPIAIRATY